MFSGRWNTPSFDQIDLPNLTVTQPNPAHDLAFRRFSSDQVVRFNKVQVDEIRAESAAPIIHNFMGRITTFDHTDLVPISISQAGTAIRWAFFWTGSEPRPQIRERFCARAIRIFRLFTTISSGPPDGADGGLWNNSRAR